MQPTQQELSKLEEEKYLGGFFLHDRNYFAEHVFLANKENTFKLK